MSEIYAEVSSTSSGLDASYRSGHETVAVLLPGFAINW